MKILTFLFIVAFSINVSADELYLGLDVDTSPVREDKPKDSKVAEHTKVDSMDLGRKMLAGSLIGLGAIVFYNSEAQRSDYDQSDYHDKVSLLGVTAVLTGVILFTFGKKKSNSVAISSLNNVPTIKYSYSIN